MLRNLKIKIFIVLIIVLTQSIFALSCANEKSIDLTNSKPQYMGNTIGNLLNFGVIANDDNSIYFTTFKGAQATLNKKNVDEEHQVIGNGLYLFLNVAGDFIYYVDDTDGAIYKMDTNGSNSEKLGDIKANFIFVVDDIIYALGGDSDRYIGNLYAMNIDGSDTRILSSDNVRQMYFYDSKLYYATLGDGQILLYKMNMDGENKELINPDQIDENTKSVKSMKWFYIYDEDIYYLTSSGMNEIRKFDVVKKEDSLLYEVGTEMPNGCINAMDNIIYFLAVETRQSYTWLNLDTGEWETSTHKDVNTVGMYTIGNKVFYYANEQPYTMNIDGSEKRRFN